MKKSHDSKILKLTSAIALSLFLFSCGSTSKAEGIPPVEETVEETSGQEESENLQEMEEEQETAETVEEPVYEPVYEPVEDIPGFYESDPKPVFLEPMGETSKTEPELTDKEQEKTESQDTEDTEIGITDGTEGNPKAAEDISIPETKKETNGDTLVAAADGNMEAEKVVSVPVQIPSDNTQEEEDSVEVAGISAVEEVESSELLSMTNEQEEEKEKPVEDKIVIVPSRSVEMKNSQYLDIVYPGTGWIYLGEEDGKTSMRYFGRKIGERNTVFSLRSREEGNTILHFYKNDQLTGKFIDDYLQVEIKGTNKSPEHAVAPAYAEMVPPKPEKKILTQPKVNAQEEQDEIPAAQVSKAQAPSPTATPKKISNTPAPKAASQKSEPKKTTVPLTADPSEDNGSKTVIQKTMSDAERKSAPKSENSVSEPEAQEKTVPTVSKSSIQNTENMAADEILEKAKESFKNKKYEDTLAYLDDFFAKATTKIDEGLILQGQTFETNSSVRNIKSALDTYETIVRRYPQSIHWAKANERITYLRKFYFNIR
ncbi:hypothetical protein [Treponema sp.]|uniref:hypothetical protein n=1 Tax=Treponema sp. TaxID=166 RepID=UPI00388D9A34